MAKTVLDEMAEVASNHDQVIPSALVCCADRRLNPLVNFLTRLIAGLYVVRNLGAFVDHYRGQQQCDGAGLADMLAGKLYWLIHIGHDGCAAAAAARNSSLLTLVLGPLLRLLTARGSVEPTDMEHSKAQLVNFMTHPLIAERVRDGKLKVLGFFVTKDGRIYAFDWETGEYVQIYCEEELYELIRISAAA